MEDVSLTAKFITPRISGCVRLNYTLTSGYKDAFLRQTSKRKNACMAALHRRACCNLENKAYPLRSIVYPRFVWHVFAVVGPLVDKSLEKFMSPRIDA